MSALSLFAIAWLAGASVLCAAPAKHVKLLAIGNSFSQNATHYLPDLVKAGGDQLTFRTITIGGCPLERHWTNSVAFEQGSTDALARAWTNLTADAWDFITIQQYSLFSFRAETFQPFASNLCAYLKSRRPGAEILIHETWAYRGDDPLYKPGFTPDDMYRAVRKNYEKVATDLGCRILPSGDAFEKARLAPDWGGSYPDAGFDRKAFTSPALPEQKHSLHRGWNWASGKNGAKELKLDAHHANTAGEYLAGCVWYEFMFGRDVTDNAFVPPGLSATDAAILRRVAHETLAEKTLRNEGAKR